MGFNPTNQTITLEKSYKYFFLQNYSENPINQRGLRTDKLYKDKILYNLLKYIAHISQTIILKLPLD